MASPLRIIFAGTPEFALPSLEALAKAHSLVNLVAVFTQPDRRAGRGRKLQASIIKQAATKLGIMVEQPTSLKDADSIMSLRNLQPDLIVVVAYGQLLTQEVLDIPRFGCWNIHASLLPRWRGAAPIQRAIEAGDTTSGVCLMQMQKGLDTGPIVARQVVNIDARETGGSLHDKLSCAGAKLLTQGISTLQQQGFINATSQAEDGACYAHKLDKREGVIDFRQHAMDIERRIRAFDPWPGTRFQLNGENVRILQARANTNNHDKSPGMLVDVNQHVMEVACAQGSLCIYQLQRPGGRPISIADYLNAKPAFKASKTI